VNAGRALLGAALAVFGGVLLADTAGMIDATASIRQGWPLVFVFLGLAQAAVERRISMVSGFLVLGGGVALVVTTGIIDADLWSLIWPILLIGAGVWLVAWRRTPAPTDAEEISRLVVFAPGRVISRASALRRAEVTSLFSSLSLDLSRARLDPAGARIAATAIFGRSWWWCPRAGGSRCAGCRSSAAGTTPRRVPTSTPALRCFGCRCSACSEASRSAIRGYGADGHRDHGDRVPLLAFT